MSHSLLPEESDQKQKNFYLKLRDKVGKWYESKADSKPEYVNYIPLVENPQ